MTKFETLVRDLSEASKLNEGEILHMQVQTAAMMYRYLTDDLDALDIVIRKTGKIKIYKLNKLVKVSNRIRELIVWAVFRTMERKVLINFKVN